MGISKLAVAGVSGEATCERKLSELVSDHVLRDEDRDVNFSIVHTEGVTDELRHDRRTARPCLQDRLATGLIESGDFLCELRIDIGSLLEATCHSE